MYSLKAFVLVLVIFYHARFSYILCQQSGEAAILTGPQTQYVAPGEMVYFNCHARGDSVFWYINGGDPHLIPGQFEARGFIFLYNHTSIPDEVDEHNNTISVEARQLNNNTVIACTAHGQIYNQVAHKEGTLIIADVPLPPSISLSMDCEENDCHSVTFHLNWSTPFTWPGFPIISYTVTIVERSHSRRSSRETNTVETVDIINSNDSTLAYHEYQYNSTGRRNDCFSVNFSVLANNSIGSGNNFSVKYNNPIEFNELGEIETAVSFLSNGTPHFWMSFFAPNICQGYQVGYYNITVYGNNSSNVIDKFGPITFTQKNAEEQELITREVKAGLTIGDHYVVEVTVESIGIVHSQNKAFNTTFSGLSCKDNKQGTLISTILGMVFLSIVCSLLLIIIVLVALIVRKRKVSEESEIDGEFPKAKPKRKKTKVTTHKMVNQNPIYEGPVYETTPGESFKPLLNSASTPSLPSACSTPHYHIISQTPTLPSPRQPYIMDQDNAQPYLDPVNEIEMIKASIKKAEQSQGSQCRDEYIVMCPHKAKKDNTIEETSINERDVTVNETVLDKNDGEDKDVILH